MSKRSRSLQSNQTIARSKELRAQSRDQPNLPFDPMPQRIEPCLALLKPVVPSGTQWCYEIKWDGYRIAVHIEQSSVRIITRGGHDWSDRFPLIAVEAQSLGLSSAILDGEAVVLDEQGRSDFSALQKSLGGRASNKASRDAIMMAFDLLYYDGHDLTGMELSSRRHLLSEIIPDHARSIRFSEAIEADGTDLLQQACNLGLEGVIAKNRDASYRSGRTGDWVKVKCIQSESFFIIGYEPGSPARGGIKSLLLAAYDEANELKYVGSVGTGFGAKEAALLKKQLDQVRSQKPPVPFPGKGVIFAQPTLIAEIEYRGWTTDAKLRHASYKGLRDQQDNAAVFRLSER